MSIHRSSARHSSASRRSSEMSLREALLDARRGTVTHRATIIPPNLYPYSFALMLMNIIAWGPQVSHHIDYFKITETVKEKGQKLKICAKKARAANKRRVAFLAKIATRWIYFIHIFRQLLVPNLSKSEQKNSVLALGAYYTD